MSKHLTPKQESFCQHYTTIGSLTFSNGTKSAIEAQYAESSAAVTATKLMKNDRIRDRVNELHSENMNRNMITVDKVLADLEHDKLLARENHQYAVAKGCTELQGRYLAMFKNRQMFETSDEIKEMDEKKQQQAERIANICLMERIG